MKRNIISVLRGVKPSEVEAIASQILEAGITTIEVTLNSPEPYESISILAKAIGSQAEIGAGTVLQVDEVARVKDAGGVLIVSPDCKPDVIRETKKLGMASWPGVLTPTECFTALDAGADGLKFFPAGSIGPSGLKAIRAVLPADTLCYAVGGAGADNMQDWKVAGANGFGIGGSIYTEGSTSQEVRARAEKIVAAYDKVFPVGS